MVFPTFYHLGWWIVLVHQQKLLRFWLLLSAGWIDPRWRTLHWNRSYQIYIFHCNNHMLLMHHIILNPYWLVWNDGMSCFINKDFFGDLLLRSAGSIDPPWPILDWMVHTRFTHFIVTITLYWFMTSYCIHIDWFGMMEYLVSSTKTFSMTCFCRVLGGLTHHGQHYTGKFISDLHIPS